MLIPPPDPAPDSALDIECIRMTKRFGAFVALDDVSMKVERGAFHALLGENGAGKSTLVKCIVGYYRPDDGQIQVNGRERDSRFRSRGTTLTRRASAWCTSTSPWCRA